ncbi:unnamed protein product [Aspergillus oryzae RIB40]|uniref:DNA, SC020 n=1 Tax=Aspergillus oryzae (strain ATCC 42149 / RIB 40) TaxID=510516 RepID=Q2U4Y7_ASPOR|nr:unnamed protein product [Aspergillus oryzae RIB40]BAE63378.1 unnamed protein product [Aspergillus oryzae RIB40]
MALITSSPRVLRAGKETVHCKRAAIPDIFNSFFVIHWCLDVRGTASDRDRFNWTINLSYGIILILRVRHCERAIPRTSMNIQYLLCATALAIKAGDHPKVTEILDSGLQVATPGHFLLATQKKDYATLKLFLSHGWDINTDIDSLVPSALVYAFEDVELLDWFLDHGADPNKESRIRDCTPLSYAVMEAPFNIVKYLFENGGQLKRGQLLHYAAMRRKDDSYEVLQFIYNEDPDYNELQINKLLDEGTSHHLMNYRSGLGTPLHYAASSGSVDMDDDSDVRFREKQDVG